MSHFAKAASLSVVLMVACTATYVWAEQQRHRRNQSKPPSEQANSPSSSQDLDLRPSSSEAPGDGITPPVIKLSSSSNNDFLPDDNPCAQKHPIETYVQISSAARPQASRSGGVYFLSDLRETPQIFHVASPKQWPEQITFFPDGVPYFSVSPNGEKILIATHMGGDEQYDIFLFEVATKRLTPLLVDRSDRIQSVAWDPGSKWFAYTSNTRNKTDMDLYEFGLADNKSKLLSELSGYHEVSDISPDGSKIAITQSRSVTDSDILIWDRTKSQLSNLTADPEEVANVSTEFTGDSKSIFLLSDHKNGIANIYLMPITPGASKKPITQSSWPVENLYFNKDRSLMAYTVNEEGYSKIEGFQLDKAGNKRRLLSVPKIPNTLLSSVTFSPAQGKTAFFFSLNGSSRNSDVWLWSDPKKTQWTHSTHGQIDTSCFSSEKLVKFPSFDKREIPAFLYLPQGYPKKGAKPIPFVIYVHGGPEGQTRPTFNKTFQYFLQRGFGIFAPNIRGSTGYGREFTQLDNYKKRMDSVKDVIAGAEWLIGSGYTRQGRLAIYGGSYGGFLVLRSIEVAPELFSAASSSVGIANFVTFLQNTKPYRRALREVEYGPLSDKEFLKSISPLTYLDQIRTPLLLFHGANDPRVPVNETDQIVEELKRRSVPFDFRIFPDEGHGNTKLRNIMEQSRLMIFFFEKYLKATK